MLLPKVQGHKLGRMVTPALTSRCHSSIKHDNSSGNVEIHWDSGSLSRVPYEFLRDNCQCPSCFNEFATQSVTLLPDVLKDSEQGIKDARVLDDQIVLQWNSGHLSKFKIDWLRERVYTRRGRDIVRDFKCNLWGSEHKLKFFDFKRFLENDGYLFEWMKVLVTEGINILKDAPRKPDQLSLLANRASGFLYSTMYGSIFTVKEKPNASNLAYTSGYLALHTDQPYYEYQPGIQYLHCITGSPKGQGVNQLVDGWKVATDLRAEHPKAFEILTTLKFLYEQRGNEMFGKFILLNDQSPIGVNQFGEIDRVSYNYPSRAASMHLSAQEMKDLYQAAGIFHKMMYDSKYMIEYQLEEGDILCFHNMRILHGRTPYDATTSQRWLEGAYTSWDNLHARMRAIEEELNNSSQ